MVSPETSNGMNNGSGMETGMNPEHLRVRNALHSLPKATCPVGFEFRLERRLAGKPVGETRKNWSMSWLGAGVGFATAMVLAVFIFDFGAIPGTTPAGMIPTATKSGVSIEQPTQVTPSTEQPVNVAQETIEATKSDALASKQDTMKDKTKPGTLPDGNYQTVGGNSGGR